MTTQAEALKLALEALEDFDSLHGDKTQEAIIAIKEALAQPQPEQGPVAWGWIDSGKLIGALDYKRHPDYITPLYTNPPQPKEPEQEPVAFMDKGKFEHLKKNNAVLTTVTSWSAFDDDVALYTTPPQRKPQFKEFIKWAGAKGYDCAQTCNSDTGEWIVLNPMTADLWKAWQAAHGIKE